MYKNAEFQELKALSEIFNITAQGKRLIIREFDSLVAQKELTTQSIDLELGLIK